MTDTSEPPTATSDQPTAQDQDQDQPTDSATRVGANRWARIGFWCTQILVIVPVWIAALRNGREGWYPTMDAATTVLRARDTFGGQFPLVGMWSSVSDKLDLATYFPGATQLYLLSVPIHLFGNEWGALIGMAALGTAWLLVAGWLLRRRLGSLGAIWGLVPFALLVWTMGSEALIDVAPMQMVTIPFAVFLVAAWSVADRDLGALPVLAFLANFLFLNHLVLTLLVPVITLSALIALAITLRASRRDRPDTRPDAQPDTQPGTRPAERRYLIRQLLISAAVTVVLWVPSIIQQLTNSPGNLTNLYNATRVDLARTVTTSHALDVIVSILTIPPFWFRDTFDAPLASSPIGAAGIVLGCLLGALIIVLGVAAARRGDRLALTALMIATVTAITSVLNILNAPTDFGFRRNYFRSLWGMAMFLWLAIGVAAVRALPRGVLRPAGRTKTLAAVGTAVVLAVAVLASPHKDPGNETNGAADSSVALARKVMNQAVVRLRDQGQVEVSSTGDFMSFGLSSTLILLLETHGVDVCVPDDMVPQYGDERACRPGGPDVRARVSSMAFPPFAGETVVIDATLLTEAEQRDKATLGREVAAWLETQDEIHASPRVRKILVDAYGPAAADRVEAFTFDDRGFGLPSLVFSPEFVEFVATRSVRHSDGTVDPAIDTGDLPPEDLVRWADLTWREYTGESVRITRLDETAAGDVSPQRNDP